MAVLPGTTAHDSSPIGTIRRCARAGLVVTALAICLLPSAVRAQEHPASGEAPHFERDVLPIFVAKCVRCHSQESRKAELDLSSFSGLSKGGESGPVVVPQKAEESPLYEKILDGEMPPDADESQRVSQTQLEIIRRWIEAGAATAHTAADVASPALNQHDVIPVLLRRCSVCHGLRRKEGELDLRSKASMLAGGKSGPAITPGSADASLLIKRINAGEMPPRHRLVEVSIKPIDPAEIDLLTRWINDGAPEVDIQPDVATTDPDPLVSDQDREFWAFKPPRTAEAPQVREQALVRNPIDAFIEQRLEQQGLTLSPQASRLTLLRRASYDLTGLPPEPEEVDAFLADERDDAYERLVDRLLDSPRFGERWARFWLDLAGYADSEGKREQDLPRPYAWRYRDYVIRAFNDNKPYDRFLLEQIAGDELHDYAHATEVSSEMYDALVATGFLRMAPDATWANITGYLTDRVEVIADEMDVLGSAVMGLTLKCARCHSHKFDPLPQRDYYRMLAVFRGAYDEYDWLKPDVLAGLGPVSEDIQPGRLMSHVTTQEFQSWQASCVSIDTAIENLRQALEQQALELTATQIRQQLSDQPELANELTELLVKKPDMLTEREKSLAEQFAALLKVDHEQLKAADPEFRQSSEDTAKTIADLQAKRLPEPRIQALWDRGEPSPTYMYRRGDPLNAGQLVGPGVPSVLTDGRTPLDVQPPFADSPSTGRRLALARWLTKPDHPLTSRVIVNRLWKHHFGAGIVTTLGNFGKAGAAPSHPELLDWLAVRFVESGWDLKAMHRLMMTSATYRQSSAVSSEQQRLDPDNALCSRMPLTRLDAESSYDAMLQVAGRLNETPGGPADRVQGRPDGLVTPVKSEKGWRRLIYVEQTRKVVATHRDSFDFPQQNPNCLERRNSNVAPQALYLMNNGMVHELAADFAKRVVLETSSDAAIDPAAQVTRAYKIALSRPPNDDELRLGVDTITALIEQWTRQLAENPSPEASSTESARAQLLALTEFCHALINSAEFLYVD